MLEKPDGVLSKARIDVEPLTCKHSACVRSLLASFLFAVVLWSLHIRLIRLYLLCGLGLNPQPRPWRSLVERVWEQISN